MAVSPMAAVPGDGHEREVSWPSSSTEHIAARWAAVVSPTLSAPCIWAAAARLEQSARLTAETTAAGCGGGGGGGGGGGPWGVLASPGLARVHDSRAKSGGSARTAGGALAGGGGGGGGRPQAMVCGADCATSARRFV